MARGRQERVGVGFMIAWLIFWAAGMMIAVFTFGGAALSGDFAAALFLVVWLAAAAVGLAAGIRKLRGLLFGDVAARPPLPPRDWNDGISNRTDTGAPPEPPRGDFRKP